MDERHWAASAGFLTSVAAGPALAFLAYVFFREPCPRVAGLPMGDCVFGQTVGQFATAAGAVCLVLGIAIAAAYGSR